LKTTLLLETDGWVVASILFIAMLASSIHGVQTGRARRKRLKEIMVKDKVADTGYLTGLFFFLLAFTFGMSGSRYDTRRKVVVEEANIIGTAILRADLYNPEERVLFRNDFKEYVEARIAYSEAKADVKKILAANEKAQAISAKLWERATRLSADQTNYDATLLMIPALNSMIDITTTRISGEKAKVPESILWMLFVLACISSFLSGYTATSKGNLDWLVEIGFCLLVSLVVMFTLDLDRPRRGFVTLDTPNQTIIDLRNQFK
jgi:hypothetical protein